MPIDEHLCLPTQHGCALTCIHWLFVPLWCADASGATRGVTCAMHMGAWLTRSKAGWAGAAIESQQP